MHVKSEYMNSSQHNTTIASVVAVVRSVLKKQYKLQATALPLVVPCWLADCKGSQRIPQTYSAIFHLMNTDLKTFWCQFKIGSENLYLRYLKEFNE